MKTSDVKICLLFIYRNIYRIFSANLDRVVIRYWICLILSPILPLGIFPSLTLRIPPMWSTWPPIANCIMKSVISMWDWLVFFVPSLGNQPILGKITYACIRWQNYTTVLFLNFRSRRRQTTLMSWRKLFDFSVMYEKIFGFSNMYRKRFGFSLMYCKFFGFSQKLEALSFSIIHCKLFGFRFTYWKRFDSTVIIRMLLCFNIIDKKLNDFSIMYK